MEPLLKHLHAALRGSCSGSAPAAFATAAMEQQLLGASSLRQEGAAELAEELVERAEQLVGSKQASQRLVGLQLLHTAIAHCHRRAFLSQHTSWAALLLATLRGEQQRVLKQDKGQAGQADAPAPPTAAAAEACACLAAYFSRVGRMMEVPGVRRDGAAAASKLAAQLLQQGQQKQGEARAAPLLALPQGQQALLAALAALPASFRQHQKALEAQLLPLLIQPSAAGCIPSPLLAACAAALPRIAGDGSTWSAFCQRLLVSAHRLADALLLGLDDASLAAAGKAGLDPAAEPLPGLVASGGGGGGGSLSGEAYAAAWGQLAAVLHTLQQLLGASYPSAVPVPTGGLLLLASRLLSVEDSASSAAAASSARLPTLCLHLPAAQAAALALLQRLLAACGAAAAPYFVAAARLLAEALQRSAAGGGSLAASAQVRCQLYSATRQLLLTAGVGAVRSLAPALLHAAAAELYGRKQQEAAGAADEGPARKKARKGKQSVAAALDGDAAASAPLDDLGAAVQQRDVAVQAAALRALHALCSAGAPLMAPPQRRQLDDLAAHVAVTSAAAVRQLSSDAESAVGANLAALQLASYQLLLATLLAPAPHRPPHMAAALALFRAGSAGGPAGGAALAPFCRSALLSCEALLHPRSLPAPAPVRRVATDLEAGDEGGATLGMPRFWNSVDAALLLQQDQAQRVQRSQQQGRSGADGAGDEEMVDADAGAAAAGKQQQALNQPQQQQQQQATPFAVQPAAATAAPTPAPAFAAPAPTPAQPQPQQAQQAQQPPAMSSMAAMLAQPTAVAAPAAPTAAKPAFAPAASAQLAPAPAAAAPAFAAKPAVPSAPAAAAAASAAAAVAAAAEESDSDGSLPEIDSGADSSSDEEEGSGGEASG